MLYTDEIIIYPIICHGSVCNRRTWDAHIRKGALVNGIGLHADWTSGTMELVVQDASMKRGHEVCICMILLG
jgi:hypothetical protein